MASAPGPSHWYQVELEAWPVCAVSKDPVSKDPRASLLGVGPKPTVGPQGIYLFMEEPVRGHGGSGRRAKDWEKRNML